MSISRDLIVSPSCSTLGDFYPRNTLLQGNYYLILEDNFGFVLMVGLVRRRMAVRGHFMDDIYV